MEHDPETQARLDELAEAAREADRQKAVGEQHERERMRERGEPVRGDFVSRSGYRAALSRYRRAAK